MSVGDGRECGANTHLGAPPHSSASWRVIRRPIHCVSTSGTNRYRPCSGRLVAGRGAGDPDIRPATGMTSTRRRAAARRRLGQPRWLRRDEDPVVWRSSGAPSTPGVAGRRRLHGIRARARLAAPNLGERGHQFDAGTAPDDPTRCPSSAVVQPTRRRRRGWTDPRGRQNRRSMSATVRGWLLVCPAPMAIGPSYAACPRSCARR